MHGCKQSCNTPVHFTTIQACSNCDTDASLSHAYWQLLVCMASTYFLWLQLVPLVLHPTVYGAQAEGYCASGVTSPEQYPPAHRCAHHSWRGVVICRLEVCMWFLADRHRNQEQDHGAGCCSICNGGKFHHYARRMQQIYFPLHLGCP